MQATMQAMSSASATNHVEIRNLMEQILQAVTQPSLGNQSSGRVIEVQDDDGMAKIPCHNEEAHPAKPKRLLCKELMDIVTQLCNRVHHNQLQGKIGSGEAKDIIRDLLSALEMMRSDEFLEAEGLSGLVNRCICSTCSRRHIDELRSGLTTIHEALSPMRQVTVNDVGRQRASGPYDKSNWTMSVCDLGRGILTVSSRTRSRKTQQQSQLDQPGSYSPSQSEEEEVTTSVSLVSGRRSRGRHGITVHVRQTYNDDGLFSSIPHLLVYNVLPMDSPVFEIVRRGRLSEFQALLRQGKASLRDQDEHGASLLFVSMPCLLHLLHSFGSLLIEFCSMRTGNLKCVDTLFSLVQT